MSRRHPSEIETRRVKGHRAARWEVADFEFGSRERHRMPKVIRVAFEQTLAAVRELGQVFQGGSDSAQGGSDGAGGGSHGAHPSVGRGLQGALPLRL